MQFSNIARGAGLSYLGLAVAGAPAFLVIRPTILDGGYAGASEAIASQPTIAHTGLALYLAVVATQVLAGLWFHRLFRAVDPAAAVRLLVYAIGGAASILIGAVGVATANALVLNESPQADPSLVGALYAFNDAAWLLGGLFFGLWLIPMGLLALRSGMPRLLGWALIAGGASYLLSTGVRILAPAAAEIGEAIASIATIGELWMIGYLLIVGAPPRLRRSAESHTLNTASTSITSSPDPSNSTPQEQTS